ncbi:hypothetical protein J6590_053290 [Homalodisca vitripennis]|nr:hypothetical protein J6590_053290 [Homalodisca vitripennis]
MNKTKLTDIISELPELPLSVNCLHSIHKRCTHIEVVAFTTRPELTSCACNSGLARLMPASYQRNELAIEISRRMSKIFDQRNEQKVSART